MQRDGPGLFGSAAAAGFGGVGCLVAAVLRCRKRRTAFTSRAATAVDAKQVTEEPWDYIIVGGGTAGCVLAKRLSEPAIDGSGKRVLVLEAGHGDHDNHHLRMPAGVLNTLQSKYDWHFVTEKGMYLARGKVLGGSSNLNVMLYTRGDASDYDSWAADFGCDGWSSSDVLRCFERTEDDRTGSTTGKNAAYHSQGGEWAVDHVRYQNPLSKKFLEAGVEAGFPMNSDFNSWGHSQEGVGRFPVSQDNGVRCSSTSALLMPALAEASRRTLKVLCGTQVSKIRFDEQRNATAVDFWAGDRLHTAQLSNGGEVLLTGGAVHSPQLLMLSGIGPATHLAEQGIPVICARPGVGENLQDQPAVNVCYQCPESKEGISPTSHTFWVLGKKIPHPAWILQWLLFRSGPLTSPGCDHGGFFRTSNAASNSADLQMRFLPARAVTPDGMNSFATFRNSRERLPDGFSFQSIAVRARSRGSVRLCSADVRDKPVIEGGHLKDSHDIVTLREGLRLARSLAKQPSFDDVRGDEVFPGEFVQSDADLDAYITRTVHTANALVGTCRMGRSDDPLAVCDPQLRVIGVKGLRVCDASVMPRIPGCQTGAPVVMVAERAAELLLS
eukprot:TRINITY_DN57348_c0_g1_i1.p1 TRINITY_DN57348_c0_g1~~TRINITY_DN57348_c0_g1_i1.p1  ORF type:complete len:611 (+),score=68.89 TRINITY_DN57348_c0_g1_i1:231-2063(+)